MTKVKKLIAFFSNMGSKKVVPSNRSVLTTVKSPNVDLIEIEDVLFHHNSAVMMPENSAVEKKKKDGDAKQEQLQLTGVKALAIVFKHSEHYPDKQILVTGHADSTGSISDNFKISRQRANGVQALLTGDIDKWCKTCQARHKVEDYQQIIKYFNKEYPGWDCDPGKIDNKFGIKTQTALNNFAKGYNRDLAKITDGEVPLVPNQAPYLPDKFGDLIKKSPGKKWSEDHWQSVYYLYNKMFCNVLGVDYKKMKKRRTDTTPRFAKTTDGNAIQVVGCSHSFPVSKVGTKKYKSQADRRVEVLFFKKDELPDLSQCPTKRTKLCKQDECPIWNKFSLQRTYIDPDDLYAVMYHLQFQYYDHIKEAVTDVPDGLKIIAYEKPTGGALKVIPSDTEYDSGVCQVKVKFSDPKPNFANKDFFFAFETTDKIIFTNAKADAPSIVTLTKVNFDAKTTKEKYKYHDLPKKWYSFNYRTWPKSEPDKDAEFQKIMKDKKIKPLGDTITAKADPLMFSLDDIVLVSVKTTGLPPVKTLDQTITDRDADASSGVKGKAVDLSDKSRVRILYIDIKDEFKLKIHGTKTAGTVQDIHKSTLITFSKNSADKHRNLIKVEKPTGIARAVVFCGEFYDVTSKRTETDADFDMTKGHVLGARAAVLNDEDVHYTKRFIDSEATNTVHVKGIGDFDLHYLHGGAVNGDNLCSYITIYWSGAVFKDTHPNHPASIADNKKPATQAEVEATRCEGMINAMNHWNKKEYKFVENNPDAHNPKNIVIQSFFMFEGNETFPWQLAGVGANFKTHSNTVFTSVGLRTALRAARGGIPKSLVFVTEELKGSWVSSTRTGGRPFTLVSLRRKAYKDDPTRFASLWTHTEYGENYICLAMAHELGHSTGQIDDYVDREATYSSYPNFGQFGLTAARVRVRNNNTIFNNRTLSSEVYPIKHDVKTMMIKNGPIRMRHVWRFVHWLNEEGKATKPLNKFLSATQFEIDYPHPAPHMTYFRTTAIKKDPWEFTNSGSITVHTNRRGRTKRVNAFLYRGLDETRRSRRSATHGGGNIDYKAILAVRFLLSIKYVDGFFQSWDNFRKIQWITRLHSCFERNSLNGKYMLSGGGGDLDPTIIRFLPGYEFFTGATPGHNNYTYCLNVKRGGNNPNINRRNILTTGESKWEKLFFFFFNKNVPGTGNPDFVTGDFGFIKDWFNGLPGVNGFNIEEV